MSDTYHCDACDVDVDSDDRAQHERSPQHLANAGRTGMSGGSIEGGSIEGGSIEGGSIEGGSIEGGSIEGSGGD